MIEEVKTAAIFKGGEWLLKYDKKQIVNAMKNFANSERTLGGHKEHSGKPYTVTRTNKVGLGGDYEYTHYPKYMVKVNGSDMSRYRVTINGEEEYWSEVKKIPVELLRLAAFQMAITEGHLYTPRFSWETDEQRDKRLKEEEE